jgi:NADP-dependent 3-hydroxy acid dehydrogenase YdfG
LYTSANETYDILMGSRTQANAEQAIEKLKQECPTSESVLTPVVIDVTDDASIEKAYEFVVKLGINRIDVLINNAGTLLSHSNTSIIHPPPCLFPVPPH